MQLMEVLGYGAHVFSRICVFMMQPSSEWGEMWQCRSA